MRTWEGLRGAGVLDKKGERNIIVAHSPVALAVYNEGVLLW